MVERVDGMIRIIFQVITVVAMPLFVLYAFYKGLKGKRNHELYAPFDDSTRGTTHRHDETNPPTDTRQLIENEQIEQVEQEEIEIEQMN